MTDADRRFRHFALAVALLCVATILYGLGSIPLISLNEARRAVPITGMFQSGNWLLPMLNGELYIDKPPLFYWAALLFAKLCNTVNEWIFRLPSALAALAIMAATYRVGLRSAGRWPAIITVTMLGSCATFLQFARHCEIEMLLSALCAGALFCAWDYIAASARRSSLYLSYALTGAALLCKGPVALLFVQLPIVLMAFTLPAARRYLASPVGWLLLLGIGLSWYGAVTLDQGMDVWDKVFHTDIQKKIQGNPNPDPVYTYLQSLLGDFFPWSLLLLLAPRKTVLGWWREPQTRFFLIATLVPFVVLTLLSDKHGKYLLPAYPVFALLLAQRLATLLAGWSSRTRRILLAGTGALMLGYLVFFAAVEDRVMHYRYSAMAEISSLQQTYPEAQLISHKEVDMRSVYYYGKTIPVVQQAQINDALRSDRPTLLLLEKEKQQAELKLEGWQVIDTITPYISKDQTATLLANPAFLALYD